MRESDITPTLKEFPFEIVSVRGRTVWDLRKGIEIAFLTADEYADLCAGKKTLRDFASRFVVGEELPDPPAVVALRAASRVEEIKDEISSALAKQMPAVKTAIKGHRAKQAASHRT